MKPFATDPDRAKGILETADPWAQRTSTVEEDIFAAMTAVREQLSRWEKPTLVAFSDSDPIFPSPKAGQVFVDLIPGAGEQVVIEGGGHFLQEDRGEVIAAAILEWARS